MSTNSIWTDEKVLELEEKALEKAKDDPWRLNFHLMPISGWMNDPNGLCEIDGRNHVFFQYSPQAVTSASPKCWGHYETDDFINYTYTLPVLYPDQEFDKHGVYSGSSFEFDDGIRAYYTGNVKHEGDYDFTRQGREHNVIVAENYDRNIGKFKDKKLLLKNSDYPDDLTLHVRDPKIVKRGDKYLMLLGARDDDDHGLVLIYESDDGYDWELKTRLSSPEMGYMWECPDLLELEEDVLILSPQGIEAQGNRFQNLYQSGYMPIGNLDSPQPGEFRELDNGFDIYAPQTYIDDDGRTILVGWMGLPDVEYTYPTDENGWIHALTIPRVLSYKDGVLYQSPLPELEKLRLNREKITLGDKVLQTEISDSCEIILEDPNELGAMIIRDGCGLFWSEEDDGILLTLSFDFSDRAKEAGAGRDNRVTWVKKLEEIRVFADTSSLEFFINGGEVTFTTRYFPNPDDHNLLVESDCSTLIIYDLGSFNVTRDSGEKLF